MDEQKKDEVMRTMKTTYHAEEKLWKGFNSPYPFEKDVFVGEKIFENLKKNPEKVIQIYHDEDEHLTASDFLTSVIRVAQNLSSMGIQSQDVAGVACLNSNNTTIFINACIMLGVPPNPIDVSFTVEDISHMFQQTKPKIVVCDYDIYLRVKSALKNIKNDAAIFTIGKVTGAKSFDELLEPTGIEDQFEPTRFPNENAFDKVLGIVCSSGTTGFSKGVCMSHAMMMPYFAYYKNSQPSRSLTFSTTYWVTGFYPAITVGFPHQDVRIITRQRFSIDILVELIEKYKVSSMIMPPSQAMEIVNSEKFLASDFSSLKSAFVGGSMVSSSLRQKLKETIPSVKFNVAYGMSEYGVTFPLGSENDTSVGKILISNAEVKIVDDNGNRMGVNEPGELCVRNSVCPFIGYYGNEKATEDAIDSEGFFKSGDVGYFDEDSQLYIIDRKKEILKYKGYQYNPSEIEAVIEQIKGVKFVSVVGVPDPIAVDLPTAVVVLKSGYEDKLTEDDILEFAASKLPVNKHLHGGVRFVDKLPMTASGKIQKKKVLEMLLKRRV